MRASCATSSRTGRSCTRSRESPFHSAQLFCPAAASSAGAAGPPEHRGGGQLTVICLIPADGRKPPQANETETLQRIWDEVPGGFLDLREGELRAQGDEFPEPEEEAAAEEGEKGALMSAEDMEALRTTVCSNLK